VRVELWGDELAEERRVVPVVEIEREDMLLVEMLESGKLENWNVGNDMKCNGMHLM
jgi:hypothetical protein